MTVELSDHGGTLTHSIYYDTDLYPLTDADGNATQCADGVNGWCAQSFNLGEMATWPIGSFSGGTWTAVFRDANGEEVTATSTDFDGAITELDYYHFTFSATFTATDSLGRTCSGGIDRLVTRRYIYRSYTYLIGWGTTRLTCE